MKKNLHLIFLTLGIAILCISGVADVMYHSGTPGKKTGSPLDGATCAQCHQSTVEEVSWISANIPETGWVPGETYTITLNAQPETASKIGFELTAEGSGKKVGTFTITDVSRTKLANSNKSVTHTADGITPSDGSNTWEFNWQAPSEIIPEVTFYAAINAANGNGSTSGDQIYTSTSTFASSQGQTFAKVSKEINFKIYPNPASEYIRVEADNEVLSVELYNQSGQLVRSYAKNELNSQLDISDLKNGTYVLKALSSSAEYTQQILKR